MLSLLRTGLYLSVEAIQCSSLSLQSIWNLCDCHCIFVLKSYSYASTINFSDVPYCPGRFPSSPFSCSLKELWVLKCSGILSEAWKVSPASLYTYHCITYMKLVFWQMSPIMLPTNYFLAFLFAIYYIDKIVSVLFVHAFEPMHIHYLRFTTSIVVYCRFAFLLALYCSDSSYYPVLSRLVCLSCVLLLWDCSVFRCTTFVTV